MAQIFQKHKKFGLKLVKKSQIVKSVLKKSTKFKKDLKKLKNVLIE